MVSCSLDQTCRVYELHSGEQLLEVVLDSALTAVVADAAESNLFVGGITGAIYQVALYSPDIHSQLGSAFTGHAARVTCLSVSIDGQLLLSGSEDRTARIWDIPSKQCVQVLQHKGHVTNGFIVPTPILLQMLGETTKPVLPFAKFKSNVDTEGRRGGITVNLATALKKEPVRERGADGTDNSPYEILNAREEDEVDENGENDREDTELSSVDELRKEVARLKQINQQLYDFAANRVISSQQDTSDGAQQ